tara:strand:+ start:3023 stop:3634 length:612 start_codon:yes stop_codon:yes gene_type:complete
MPSIHFNYGSWWNWLPTDEGGHPNQKVAFDGATRTIYVAEGITDLDTKIDIYSAWKEWAQFATEAPAPRVWSKAISAVGGDPITDNVDLGITFFLENGWRIQPAPSKTSYVLTIVGNLYTREPGEIPFRFAEGVSVSLQRSNIVEQITVEALSVAITDQDITNISNAAADKVWDELLVNHQIEGSAGHKLKSNLKKTHYIARI